MTTTNALDIAQPVTREIAPTGADLAPMALDAQALIARAIDAGMPVESMARLLAMRAELKAEAARAAWSAALASFQARVPPIAKTKTARAGSFAYNYADLAGIMASIGPALTFAGLSVTFDTEEAHDGASLKVVCRVHHLAGHSESASFPVPVDKAARMTAPQQVGAALTYGRRYALTAALGIVTADEDTDAQGCNPPPEHRRTTGTPPPASPDPRPTHGASDTKGASPITPAQKKRLEARLTELGLQPHRQRIKNWTAAKWGVDSLANLTRDQYDILYPTLEGFAERIALETEASHQADPTNQDRKA